MGIAVLRPSSAGPAGQIADNNYNTYIAGSTNGDNIVDASYRLTFTAPYGYPSGRIIQQMRLAAVLYQSRPGVQSWVSSPGSGLGLALLTGTTEYTTVYSAWAGVNPGDGAVLALEWHTDGRGFGVTNYRIMDAWVEIQYADY